MSEWLRSLTANQVGIARAGSNPAVIVEVNHYFNYAAIAQLVEREFSKLKVSSSNLDGGWGLVSPNYKKKLVCGSIMVSISACHAEDRGSIPRHRDKLL